MQSIWSSDIQIPERESFKGRVKIPAVVIGAGIAGVLTAYFLEKAGIKTILLEADRIGGGQTKNTTAKITSQHGLLYSTLYNKLNLEQAQQYAILQENAIKKFRNLVKKENILCDWKDCSAYLYTNENYSLLQQEADIAVKLGLNAELVKGKEFQIPNAGLLEFKNQACFHPMKFLKAIQSSLTVFENSMVQKVEENHVILEEGEIEAENIVFACHYPFINVPGYYFLRMHQERSYIVALEQAGEIEGIYYGVDRDGLSLRQAGKYLLLGGMGSRTGEDREESHSADHQKSRMGGALAHTGKGAYETLFALAEKYFPKSKVSAYWSAQDCMTLDGIPYIGNYSGDTPNWYVATGFGKWGMTNAMVSAQIISDKILENNTDYAEVVSPQRFTLSASAKTLFTEGIHAAKGLAKEFCLPAKEKTDQIMCGCAGIVEYDGEKAGVYRDEQGKLHFVHTRCPHLGCELAWNPEELSWDCPCHGSRFDYFGNLLDNPAMKGIKKNG